MYSDSVTLSMSLTDDWRGNVDEPIGKKWRYSKENDVVQQISAVFLDLRNRKEQMR